MIIRHVLNDFVNVVRKRINKSITFLNSPTANISKYKLFMCCNDKTLVARIWEIIHLQLHIFVAESAGLLQVN